MNISEIAGKPNAQLELVAVADRCAGDRKGRADAVGKGEIDHRRRGIIVELNRGFAKGSDVDSRAQADGTEHGIAGEQGSVDDYESMSRTELRELESERDRGSGIDRIKFPADGEVLGREEGEISRHGNENREKRERWEEGTGRGIINEERAAGLQGGRHFDIPKFTKRTPKTGEKHREVKRVAIVAEMIMKNLICGGESLRSNWIVGIGGNS
jgi:hypothetical protein